MFFPQILSRKQTNLAHKLKEENEKWIQIWWRIKMKIKTQNRINRRPSNSCRCLHFWTDLSILMRKTWTFWQLTRKSNLGDSKQGLSGYSQPRIILIFWGRLLSVIGILILCYGNTSDRSNRSCISKTILNLTLNSDTINEVRVSD